MKERSPSELNIEDQRRFLSHLVVTILNDWSENYTGNTGGDPDFIPVVDDVVQFEIEKLFGLDSKCQTLDRKDAAVVLKENLSDGDLAIVIDSDLIDTPYNIGILIQGDMQGKETVRIPCLLVNPEYLEELGGKPFQVIGRMLEHFILYYQKQVIDDPSQFTGQITPPTGLVGIRKKQSS